MRHSNHGHSRRLSAYATQAYAKDADGLNTNPETINVSPTNTNRTNRMAKSNFKILRQGGFGSMKGGLSRSSNVRKDSYFTPGFNQRGSHLEMQAQSLGNQYSMDLPPQPNMFAPQAPQEQPPIIIAYSESSSEDSEEVRRRKRKRRLKKLRKQKAKYQNYDQYSQASDPMFQSMLMMQQVQSGMMVQQMFKSYMNQMNQADDSSSSEDDKRLDDELEHYQQQNQRVYGNGMLDPLSQALVHKLLMSDGRQQPHKNFKRRRGSYDDSGDDSDMDENGNRRKKRRRGKKGKGKKKEPQVIVPEKVEEVVEPVIPPASERCLKNLKKFKHVTTMICWVQRFDRNIRYDILIRQKEAKSYFKENYADVLEITTKKIYGLIEPVLTELVSDPGNDLDIVSKTLTSGEKFINLTRLHQFILRILEPILNMVKTLDVYEDKISQSDKKMYTFLSKICLENGRFPDHYLHNFEMTRICFKSTGSLTNVKRDQSSLLIGMFLILRVLIVNILINYWDLPYHKNAKKVKNVINIQVIAACLYHLWIVDIQDIIPKYEDNGLDRLDPKLIPKKMKPGSWLFTKNTDVKFSNKNTLGEKEVIIGVFTKTDLAAWYSNQVRFDEEINLQEDILTTSLETIITFDDFFKMDQVRKKWNIRESIAKKMEKLDPAYSKELMKTVIKNRKQLNLDDDSDDDGPPLQIQTEKKLKSEKSNVPKKDGPHSSKVNNIASVNNVPSKNLDLQTTPTNVDYSKAKQFDSMQSESEESED